MCLYLSEHVWLCVCVCVFVSMHVCLLYACAILLSRTTYPLCLVAAFVVITNVIPSLLTIVTMEHRLLLPIITTAIITSLST